VINRQLESIFEVAEELGEFRWAGIQWESFRPKDYTAGKAVFQVLHKLAPVA
jgi:hypothetical protein